MCSLGGLFISSELKSWSDGRQYILLHITIRTERDLITIYKNMFEEFKQTINSLQDNYTDLMIEKLQQQDIFSSLSQKTRVDLIAEISQLETRVKDLTDEKDQLQRDFDSLNKKGPVCFFVSSDWSDSRQYCRDHGGDLVIINTEEKQVSLCECLLMNESNHTYSLWIGLSDTENKGIMKWVDNSPLKQGFWLKGEPSNYGGNEDCIELNYNREKTGWSPLNSWNDDVCSEKKKGICEK
uniref:Si:ch73-343l4.8 n=1 Tax=Sinocyclocheilus anshuiensis TaxID=1608454 RepID=A0A671NU56_9TELE